MLLRQLQALSDRTTENNPYYILAVVCSAMFLDLANLSAITIALPTIQTDFGINISDLQWIISAYALTFGGFLLLGGRGGDIFGHRRVLLFGMVFFALLSLVCAVSPKFIGLVIARAFQGIGATFTIPPAQAHIALHFTEPTMKAKALGIWGAAGSLGFITGLILGGVLTAFLGWRWIFWISLTISGFVIPAAYVVLPRVPTPRATSPPPSDGASTGDCAPALKRGPIRSVRERLTRFDVLGIFIGIPGILLFTYALTSANTEGWNDAKIIATLVVSVVLLVIFILHERSASQAILAPHLFRNLSFNLTLVLAVNTYAIRQACTYFLTVQLQSYGASAIHTSVLFIPLGVSALIFNTLSGRLVPILGARAMFIIGWALSIPSILLFSFIAEHNSYWRYTFPGMILYIAGIGAVYITANFVVVSSASKSDKGAAAGVFNLALQVGGSVLGLAVLSTVAEGIEKAYGNVDLPQGKLSDIGYRSVYYSCAILSGIGLFLSVLAIKVPDSMRGSVWKKKADASAVTETSLSHELQPTQSQHS